MNFDTCLALTKDVRAWEKAYKDEYDLYNAQTAHMKDVVQADGLLPDWYVKGLDAHKVVLDRIAEQLKEKRKAEARAYAAYEAEREAAYQAEREAEEAEEDFEEDFEEAV